MKRIVFILSVFIIFSSCQTNNEEQKKTKTKIKVVASSSEQWTGLTMSREGRLFVNYPRWSPAINQSVAEIKDEKSVLFPNKEWNTWDSTMNPEKHFICVQSVFIDDNNHLWVLDPANPMFQGVVPGGAKLLKFNIESGKLLNKFVFEEEIVKPNSYLNDVRIDEERGFAYITDSNDGAIITLNLRSGEARRLLDNHFSTEPELPLVIDGKPWTDANGNIQFIASDGIALDNDNEYLYYHALSGLSLYRINTKHLRNWNLSTQELTENVEFVSRTGASDGLITGPENEIYHSNVEKNAIVKYVQNGKTSIVVKDGRIKWPDTFTFGPDGNLYFTTSQIHISEPKEPYKIFKIELK